MVHHFLDRIDEDAPVAIFTNQPLQMTDLIELGERLVELLLEFSFRNSLLLPWIVVEKNVFFLFSERKLIEQLLSNLLLLNEVLQADLVLLVLPLHISYSRK